MAIELSLNSLIYPAFFNFMPQKLEADAHTIQLVTPTVIYHSLGNCLETLTVEYFLTELVRDGGAKPQVHVTTSIHQIGTMTVDMRRRQRQQWRLWYHSFIAIYGVLKT
jgi:hypothetical protein